jgi:hypothetical protein
VSGRIVGILVAVAVIVVAVFFYIADFLTAAPATLAATTQNGATSLTLQTVASYGHAPAPDWVTYLGRDSDGNWHHTTIYQLPAHTLVHVTIYNFDGASGLRNPFLAQIRGTAGGVAFYNGRPTSTINGDDASHTFTVPDLGISVPLPGVGDNAPNQCSVAPCPLSQAHRTITFSFRTPGPGNYRWQCFVPCAAAFYYGFGGPMQTIGWMSGWLKIV